MPKILQLIYTSVLSPSSSISEVSSIIRTSRTRNFSFGITGVLLFDGQQFCQYIEGEPNQVNTLSENIKKDSRNDDFKVLYSNTVEDMRRFSNWRAGYPMECSPEYMSKIISNPRNSVLINFLQMTTSFDLV